MFCTCKLVILQLLARYNLLIFMNELNLTFLSTHTRSLQKTIRCAWLSLFYLITR